MIHDSRPLEYWLSPQLGQAGHGASSVLRRMALNDAQSKATGLMLYFWAGWLLAIAITLLILAPTLALYAVVPGAFLALVAVLLQRRRSRRTVPSHAYPASSRAPRTVRGAWTGVTLAAVAVSAVFVVAILSGQANLDANSVVGGILGVLFIIALFVGTLVIPAWHIEHAERLFRERIRSEEPLRQELEGMARTYTDPSGRLPFGPL